MASKSIIPSSKLSLPGWATMLLLLAVPLSLLLGAVYFPGVTMFSNDGPLGNLVARCHHLPGRFLGCWHDLNSIGYRDPTATPGISYGLQFLLGPVLFSKLYPILGLMILGFGAWTCFRQMNFTPAACILGGLAGALNQCFFTAASWGIAAHPITVGMSFFALGALVSAPARRGWRRAALVALAGLAIGLGVTEGADVGAIFSLYLAAFVICQAWMAEGPRPKNLALGTSQVALLAVCAGLLATSAISEFVSDDIRGIVASFGGTEAKTPTERWDWATQWSLPKKEALSLIAPGLFGYRLDMTDGGKYWGGIGRDPAWDRYEDNGRQGPPPIGFQRYTGGSSYAGVLTMLIAAWAAAQSFRRNESVFTVTQRKWIWFWSAAAVVSLLLALGRFAPFYRLLYSLPYGSAIRNPTKFLHPFNFALIILFACGLDGMWRKYMRPGPAARGAGNAVKAGKKEARPAGFETIWTRACLVALGLGAVGWIIYAASRQSLESHLEDLQFNDTQARMMAGFSIGQIGWFLFFFALATGLMILILRGAFSGTRAVRGAVLIGLLLALDLGRADEPWVIYLNYPRQYETNPILDILRNKPYEHRVAILPFNTSTPARPSVLSQVYRMGWAQRQFPYFNIESLDTVQLPRKPADLAAFDDAFSLRAGSTSDSRFMAVGRQWELTATRYILSPASTVDFLNRYVDPAQRRFRIVARFDMVPKPGVATSGDMRADDFTAAPNVNGSSALVEFTGALPRAKLYSQWQINTNGPATLDELASASFHPQQTVVVAGPLPEAAPGTNQNDGAVEFESYAPTNIRLKSSASAASILLLNDRFDAGWHVWVDGRPETLLRCNYLMRGVYLTPGAHEIRFGYRQPAWPLYVSLGAIVAGLLLLGLVLTTEATEAPGEQLRAATSPGATSPRGQTPPKGGEMEPASESRKQRRGEKKNGRR